MIKLITPPGMLLTVALMVIYGAYAFLIGLIERSWVLGVAGSLTIIACYGTAMLRPWSRFLVYLLTSGFVAKLAASIYSARVAGYFEFQFASAAEAMRSLAPSMLMVLISGACSVIVYRHFRRAAKAEATAAAYPQQAAATEEPPGLS
jgi:hypothetical protein